MTVSSTSNKISYSGNGTTTTFAFPHYFLADGDLTVVLRNPAGNETTQAIITDYSVSGAGNTMGGTVTMLVPPASGDTLVILREMTLTQDVDYTPNGLFPAETHELALDRLAMQIQQHEEALESV